MRRRQQLLGCDRADDPAAGAQRGRAPLDPASGLGALARDTGGFLIRDTNDIAGGLRRVEEELGAYYLLSYAPRTRAGTAATAGSSCARDGPG